MSFMERLVVPKARRSARVPRTTIWGVNILHPDQQNVQQDELEALEALCFLSAGISHLPADAVKPHSASRPGRAGTRRQQSKQQSKQPKSKQQRLPQLKKSARRSPGSETSSGATQCALTPAQAAELQPALSLEEIHPAALLGPDVVQRLQQQHADSSDTRLVAGTLTPMPSEDWAAQSRQRSPGPQAVPPSPKPLQQEQQQHEAEPDAVVPSHSPVAAQQSPALPSSATGVRPWELLPAAAPPQQQLPALNKPPVKGCFYHVYIAKMIQADQQRQEQQRQQQQKNQDKQPGGQQQQQAKQVKQQHSVNKRPQQQQDAQAAAHAAAAPVKKQRIEQQQRRSQLSNVGAVLAPPAAVQLAPSMPQHTAAVQHILAQTLLQQRQQQPPGVSALLRQQMPNAAALLQTPAAVQPSALDLLQGLPPAVAAAAAGCPQLLQALGAAAAPRVAAPGGLFGPAGLLAGAGGVLGGSLQGPQAAAAALRLFGALPGHFPAPAAGLAQLQGLLGSVGQLSAAMAPPAAPGAGSLAAFMDGGGMQPHMHTSRIAA